MMKPDNGKKFALIAAICCLVDAAYCTFNMVRWIENIINYHYYDYEWVLYIASEIIILVALICMTAALFLANKKAAIAAAGVRLLWVFYVLVVFVVFRSESGILYLADSSFLNLLLNSLLYLVDLTAYAALLGILILALKGNKAVQKIWFAPGAAMLLRSLIYWFFYWFNLFNWFREGYYNFAGLKIGVLSMLFSGLEIAELVFIGLWLKKNASSGQNAPVNEYGTSNPQSVYSASESSAAIGGADKLIMYKDLLESGVITQEEFDTKKKQILGL